MAQEMKDPPTQDKTLLLLVPDLMFAERIEQAARRQGCRIVSLSLDGDYDAALGIELPSLVLLTFDRTGDAWQRLAAAAQRAGVRAVAFGSHMNVDAFRRASELGCQVMANSRFSAELTSLLKKWLA